MSIYALPSFINLVIKLWLFWYGRESIFTKNWFLGFLLLSFFTLNLVEFLQFYLHNEKYSLANILAYWSVAVVTATAMLMFADQLTYRKIPLTLPVIVMTIFCYFILFTDSLIAGVDSIGYSITRIPGPNYWILQTYLLLSITGSILLLLHGGFFHNDVQQKKKCTVAFFALFPVVAVTIVIMVLMQLGLKINAAIIVSTAVTFFLAILIFAEIHYSLFNFLTSTPIISLKVIRQIIALMVTIYQKRSISLKSFLQSLENIFIIAALEINEGNRRQTAEQLNMHVSSLNKKLQKLKSN